MGMLTASPETRSSGEETLLAALRPLQSRLANHPLYRSIRTLPALRLFMESHVYAVWDFMSLLKSLQRALTCIEVPWVPSAEAASRRLVNEIVLGEESDLYEGDALSHFELYLRAMKSCGADTAAAEAMIGQLKTGVSVDAALRHVPEEARQFVWTTFSVIQSGQPHRIAAAFAFGREDLIPDMFSTFIRALDRELPGQIAPFRYYLERHIEMDGDEHGPMALQMIRSLCPTVNHWQEAADSAALALEARLALWDGILGRLEQAAPRGHGGSSNI